MKFGDTAYIVTDEEVLAVKILKVITLKGVVTGYSFCSQESVPEKMHKKYVFADKEDADKIFFINKLKSAEDERKAPVEDKKGNRHWIQGYKKR